MALDIDFKIQVLYVRNVFQKYYYYTNNYLNALKCA